MNNTFSKLNIFYKYAIIFVFIIFNLFLSEPIIAQYKLAITNGKILSDKSYEFDIFIKSTGEEFVLSSYQCALTLNKSSINGGQITFSYISGSSELSIYPENSIGTRTESGFIKLCFASNVSNNTIGNSIIRVGKFNLQNTNVFNFDSLNICWDFDGNIRTFITDYNFTDVTKIDNFSDLNQPLPTPVEQINVSVEINNDVPIINWTSITELNVQKYEIERMLPGETTWQYIGFVNASSTSSAVSKYNFTDNNITSSGVYKYRLKIIDLDGKYSYSDIVEKDIKRSIGFGLYQNYPNPFNPSTTIKYSLPSASQVKLIVYNTLGQEITTLVNALQSEGDFYTTFNAADLPSGNYFYVLNVKSAVNEKEYRDVRKMIVLK